MNGKITLLIAGSVLLFSIVLGIVFNKYLEKFATTKSTSNITLNKDSIQFGEKWAIKMEGDYLVIRNIAAKEDKRYAFTPNSFKTFP